MHRCAFAFAALALAAALVAPPALAQMPRPFPATALRGDLTFGQPPEASLNGTPVRLSPGARIRGADNMLLMSGALVGQGFKVHYTLEPGTGLLRDVWLLRPEEAARKPWPTEPEQLKTWVFDWNTQSWSKP